MLGIQLESQAHPSGNLLINEVVDIFRGNSPQCLYGICLKNPGREGYLTYDVGDGQAGWDYDNRR